MCIEKIWNILFPKKRKCNFNGSAVIVEEKKEEQSTIIKEESQNYWAILEHIMTGLRYYSLPYDNVDKFYPGEVVCDIYSREYLIIGWTTKQPTETLVKVFKCSVWDEL